MQVEKVTGYKLTLSKREMEYLCIMINATDMEDEEERYNQDEHWKEDSKYDYSVVEDICETMHDALDWVW